MKKLSIFVILVLILFAAYAFALGSPEKAKEAIAQGALVIDVRTPEEFAKGHVEGALNIPHGEIGERLNEITAAKTDPIVVYCAVGGRATIAKKVLKNNGFENVINGGGFDSLKK